MGVSCEEGHSDCVQSHSGHQKKKGRGGGKQQRLNQCRHISHRNVAFVIAPGGVQWWYIDMKIAGSNGCFLIFLMFFYQILVVG